MFPDLKRAQIKVEAVRSEFAGPLPPPEMLADYDRVVAGLAMSIVDYWRGEQRHRWEMDKRYARLDAAGLVCATLVALVCIVGGFYIITTGATAAGISAVLLPIAGIVAAYLVAAKQPGGGGPSGSAEVAEERNHN